MIFLFLNAYSCFDCDLLLSHFKATVVKSMTFNIPGKMVNTMLQSATEPNFCSFNKKLLIIGIKSKSFLPLAPLIIPLSVLAFPASALSDSFTTREK